MKIFVDKSYFSSDKNLILEKDSFYWSKESGGVFDLKLDFSTKSSLNKYIGLYDQDPLSFIDKSHIKVAKTLGIKNPNWKFFLKEEDYNKNYKKFQRDLLKVQSIIEDEKYSESFALGNSVLRSLSRIKPDQTLIRDFLRQKNNPTLKSIISSFIPKKDGYCDPITYDRLKTVTGRLVVESGPQVLLLPREMKSVFKSRYGKDGRIYWVDFVSLEPRFTKLLISGEAELDIYTDILKKSDISCTRKQIKLAVLATLFGAGLSKISEIVNEEAFVAKKTINEYFSLKEVLNKAGNFNSGKIKNYFQRPIKLKKNRSNVALNNYIQSSSVDVSLIGFSKLVEDCKSLESVLSLCVIHDALVLDVRKKESEELESIINKGIRIPGLGHFHLGFEFYESKC